MTAAYPYHPPIPLPAYPPHTHTLHPTCISAHPHSPSIPSNHRVLIFEDGLPGSNGSKTPGQVTAAGLIIVLIGNFVQVCFLCRGRERREWRHSGHSAASRQPFG